MQPSLKMRSCSLQHSGREEFKLAPQVRFILAKVLPAKPKASGEHTCSAPLCVCVCVCVCVFVCL